MSRKKVLVCDDELYILECVRYVVEHEHYQALTAENGEDCLKKFRENAPDLVLLDVMMPGKNGYEVCREIKDHKSCHTRVILLTARGQDYDRVCGYANGADDYVTKPFSPRELRERLHKFLDDPA